MRGENQTEISGSGANGGAKRAVIGAGAVGGVTAFTLAWIVLGTVVSGYDATREYVSGLAARETPHAELMVVAFFALAVGELCAACCWGRVRWGRPAALVLAASSVSTFIAGGFQQRCSTMVEGCWERVSGEGVLSSTGIHGYSSGLAFTLPIVAALVAAWTLRHDRSRRRELAVSAAVGVFCGIGALAWIARITIGHGGTLQRVVALVLFGWVGAAAWLTSESGRPSQSDPDDVDHSVDLRIEPHHVDLRVSDDQPLLSPESERRGAQGQRI